MRYLYFFLFISFRLIGLEPIAVFLNLPENPTDGIKACWVESGDPKPQVFKFRNQAEDYWFEPQKIASQKFPGALPYTLHSVNLIGLNPNARYEFVIDAKSYTFTMVPSAPPLKFVVGGDVYHDSIEDLEIISAVAARQNPDFVLLGGDISYSGSRFSFINESGKRWIEFLTSFSKSMVKDDGSLIPFTAAIGNHDVNGRFSQTPEQAPLFYFLFPSQLKEGEVLDFGTYMSLWILDSGHAHPVAGSQVTWLDKTLEERKRVPWKCAIYHVPAYPSVRSFYNRHSVAVRTHWVPIFDKHNLTVAFEHHDHAYKRTHLLKRGQIDKAGVLYMGDGAYGVASPRTPYTPKELKYLAKSASEKHFILVTVNEEAISFDAINSNGVTFDTFTR